MQFIKLSFKLAGQYKNRLKAGMSLIFLQNASVLFGFFALFLSFSWMGDTSNHHIWMIFGVLFREFGKIKFSRSSTTATSFGRLADSALETRF